MPLLTAIAAAWGWRAAFGALAALALGGAALARRMLDPADAPPRTPAPAPGFLAAYRPLVRHRPTLALLAANVLGRAGTAALTTYLGAFYAARHGFTPQQIGAVYFSLGLGILAGTAALGGPLGRLPLLPALIGTRAATGVLVAIALLLPLHPLAVAALLVPAMGCIAASTVAATTLLASEAPGGRATAMALNSTAMHLGTALGGAAGGLLLALASYPGLGVGALALYVAAAALLHRARPRGSVAGGMPHPAVGAAAGSADQTDTSPGRASTQ